MTGGTSHDVLVHVNIDSLDERFGIVAQSVKDPAEDGLKPSPIA